MSKSAAQQTGTTSSDVLAIYLQNNKVEPDQLPGVIAMLRGAPAPAATVEMPGVPAPAVPAKSSRKAGKTSAKTSARASARASAKPAKPVVAKPVVAKPVVAKPVVAKPVVAKPAVAKAPAAQKPVRVRPRKEVAKANNSGAFVLDTSIPSASIKGAKGVSRTKFLGKRQVNDPAVPIAESVTQDYLYCLEDGKKFKMMKRHLRATYGMSPEQYKAKWGLPDDYPMAAPGYALEKSSYAKLQGLGTAENKQHKQSSAKELSQAVRAGV